MRLWIALIVALAMFAGTAPAQQGNAPPVVPYKNIGAWTIQIEIARDRGCFIHSTAPGPSIRIAYDDKRTLVVGLESEAWQRSLEPGRHYTMSIRVDDRDHPGAMVARRLRDGYIILERHLNDPATARQFLEDFQRGNRLSVLYEGRQLATYRLVSSALAGEELLRCQAEQDRNRPQTAGGTPVDDPFRKGPASPTGPVTPGNAPVASLPALTADQRVDVVRLAANLLTKLPGFRLLNEEEQQARNKQFADLKAAVVWSSENIIGAIHLFPNQKEENIPTLVAAIIGGNAKQCKERFSTMTEPDVRSPSVRRIHSTCTEGATGAHLRVILMPTGKGSVYFFVTEGTLKDEAAVQRADELLRNALFEVVKQ